MLRLITITATLALAGSALAQQTSTLVKVPTGYQVKGCTFYKLVNGEVRPVCPDKMTAAERVRASVTPGDQGYLGSDGAAAPAAK